MVLIHDGIRFGFHDGRPPMIDSGLLTLVQWLSPAFPTGAFAYSQGLETAIAQGWVKDAASLKDWVADGLDHGSGQADAVLLAAVLQGGDPISLRDRALALAPSRERASETLALGAAFVRTVTALGGLPADMAEQGDWPLPVAVGMAAGGLGLAPGLVVALYLQNWAQSLVQIGVRAIPLGQTEGQQVLSLVTPFITAATAKAMETPPDAIVQSSFRGDMAGMLHEVQDVRLFRT